MRQEPTWTEPVMDRLRELWASGMPTAEIGRRLKKSKNAIVAKAHRLDLDARPSPIAHVDPETTEKARALLRNGFTPREVSDLTGIKRSAAQHLRGKMDLLRLPPHRGIRLVPSKGRAPTTNATEDDRIQKLHANGAGHGKIARQTGFSEDVVRRVLGRTRNPVPRPPSVLPPMPAASVLTPPKPVIPTPARTEAPRSPRPVRECCWPIGDPRTKAFRFCGGAVVLGKPYCEGHCRDGYTKVRDRDREQAA